MEKGTTSRGREDPKLSARRSSGAEPIAPGNVNGKTPGIPAEVRQGQLVASNKSRRPRSSNYCTFYIDIVETAFDLRSVPRSVKFIVQSSRRGGLVKRGERKRFVIKIFRFLSPINRRFNRFSTFDPRQCIEKDCFVKKKEKKCMEINKLI